MPQDFFNVVMMITGALAGWWMKVMWESLKALELADRMLTERVSQIDVLVAGQYVKRADFEVKLNEMSSAIFKKLDRIEDKVDAKADKSHHGP